MVSFGPPGGNGHRGGSVSPIVRHGPPTAMRITRQSGCAEEPTCLLPEIFCSPATVRAGAEFEVAAAQFRQSLSSVETMLTGGSYRRGRGCDDVSLLPLSRSSAEPMPGLAGLFSLMDVSRWSPAPRARSASAWRRARWRPLSSSMAASQLRRRCGRFARDAAKAAGGLRCH